MMASGDQTLDQRCRGQGTCECMDTMVETHTLFKRVYSMVDL